jgi:hypothetical protein
MTLFVEVILAAGFEPGKDIAIALDVSRRTGYRNIPSLVPVSPAISPILHQSLMPGPWAPSPFAVGAPFSEALRAERTRLAAATTRMHPII